MSRGTRRSARTAALLATLAIAAAAPAAGQPPRTQLASRQAQAQPAAPTPREIAAGAHASLLMIRALAADGDTVGLGTGFVISPDGLFITNYHVIEEAAKLQVSLLDGGSWEQVSLVSADPASDLALMQLPAHGLRAMKLGSDTQMEVGDKIYVMGNPLGMGGTFTDGMISGKRPLEGIAMLQISAPISPGSSGGPVMNERGEVIGVATMMVMGGQNLNMAVPVRYARPMLASRGTPRPFSRAVLVSNPHAGLARVGDHPEPALGGESGSIVRRREPGREVEDQFVVIAPMLQMRGFVRAFPVATGSAARDAAEAHDFTLEKGVSYLITARCDAECTNVDLGLYDRGDHLLQSDTDSDDFPTLAFTPQETGTYHVSVRMAQCGTPECSYGVAVFRRDAASTPASAKVGR
ncbi:MAG TPA: S1C family serine protease [Longimicrobium sp.]